MREYTMTQIPAIDAVNSARRGIIDGDGFVMVARMHDESIPNKNNGSAFKQTIPLVIETNGPICIETVFNTTSEFELRNLSDDFWEEADLMYRDFSPNGTVEKGEDYNIEDLPHIEQEVLMNIHSVAERGNQISREATNEILRAASRELKDMDFLPDESGREFTEGTYTNNQPYLPDIDSLSRWGLYTYNWDTDRLNSCSLWVRYETQAGEVKEAPLLYNTDGISVLVSMDVEFGHVGEAYADEALLKALNGDDVELTGFNKQLYQMAQNLSLGPKTEDFLNNVEDSEEINSSDE